MTHHVLKCKDPFFSAVQRGAKRFEVRQYTAQRCEACDNCTTRTCSCRVDSEICPMKCLAPRAERDFKVGDTLRMHKNDSDSTSLFRIVYVLKDTDYPDGLKPGYCVLGLEPANITAEQFAMER